MTKPPKHNTKTMKSKEHFYGSGLVYMFEVAINFPDIPEFNTTNFWEHPNIHPVAEYLYWLYPEPIYWWHQK